MLIFIGVCVIAMVWLVIVRQVDKDGGTVELIIYLDFNLYFDELVNFMDVQLLTAELLQLCTCKMLIHLKSMQGGASYELHAFP